MSLPLPKVGSRWTAYRKAAVVEAIDRGEITEDDACARYGIEPEELALWRSRLAWDGPKGLRSCYAQDYRPGYRPDRPRTRVARYP